MNNFQPLDQVNLIIASAINRTAKVRKNFESFFIETMISVVNVARETTDKIYEATGRKLSVPSVKKVLHNASLYQHIKEFIEGSEIRQTEK